MQGECFQNLGGLFLSVSMLRILMFWGVNWGPYFVKRHLALWVCCFHGAFCFDRIYAWDEIQVLEGGKTPMYIRL